MQPEQQQRIMGYFIEEAKDHLNTIEQGLLNLQGTMADPELVNEVFRAAHSVKGGAAMLGLNSIQKTAHRLEDYFKVLKETPTIQPDRKLETLLLKVFDTLKEHLEQLQTPAGLDAEAAQASLIQLEPVFLEVEQHLTRLERQATSTGKNPETVAQSEAVVQDNALLLIFQNDVPAQLREMLQTFRQAETTLDARERLQDICLGLQGLGDAFGLAKWSELIETASKAIANSENAYRELAPLVITEIKQAQGLVLAGRAKQIAPSEQLKAMVPAVSDAADMDLELADFFAIANSETSDELDFSGLDFAADAAVDDSSLNGLFDLPESNEISADEISLNGMFDVAGLEAAPAETAIGRGDRNGPDMGMEELNSLADLFEGEMPDLGATWQQEEVIDSSVLSDSLSDAFSEGEADDFANFLSDTAKTNGDLAGLFSNDLLSELDRADSSLSPLDEFELPDFSEDVTEFGTSLETNGTARTTSENAEFADLGFDELELISQNVNDSSIGDFEAEDEGSLDNLSELFAGLDDADLNFSATSNDAGNLESVDAVELNDLDRMFEASSAESLNLDDFEVDTLDLNGALNEPSTTPQIELAPDPWDSLALEASSALLEASNHSNGSSVADSLASDASELEISGFTAEDLELSALELDDQGDAALDALFVGEFSDEAAIEDLSLDMSESTMIQEDDLALDDLFGESSSLETELSNSTDSNLDELSGLNFGGDEQASLETELSHLTAADPSLDELEAFNFDEFALLEAEPGSSIAASSDLVELDLNDGFSLNGFSPLESADQASEIVADDFSGIFSLEESIDESVTNPGTLNRESEDPFADLLDFSSSEFSLAAELGSSGDLLPDLEDSISELLDFSSVSETQSAGNLAETDESSFDLDALIASEPLEQEPLFEQTQDDRLNEFDFDAVTPQAAEAGLDTEFDLGFAEASAKDDFSDLSLELFGAEPQAQETIEQSLVGDFDNLTGSSDDLDALLIDEEPSDDSADSILGIEIGAAAIAGFGVAAMNSDSTLPENELDDLDQLLDSTTLDQTYEQSTALDDLDSLLDETPEIAIDENFNDLESLLADAPEAETTQANFAATHKVDAEFGDLEKMLEEADMNMGGSSAAKNRAATPLGRRSTRATKGFSEQTMRVPVKHLDNLSNLVGELVVNRNSLEQDQERLRQSLDNLLYQVQQLSDVGQRMQDLYERSLLESSLLASRQNHRVPFGNSDRNAGNGNSIGVEYDPLEMDRFSTLR